MKSNKKDLLTIIAVVFVACLLISNILAAKTFTIGSIVLPTAVIVFPIVYIVNDVLAEIYGFKKARQVIYLGFLINLMAVICYTIAIALPAPVFATDISNAFEITLGSTWRMLIASFTAYLIGSLLNAFVMVKMKERLKKYLMLRCMASTLVGEGIDAAIFITIAFIGTMSLNGLLVMIAAQTLFKTLFEVICYPLTKQVISYVNKLPE